MITYKYSLIEDIKAHLSFLKYFRFLKNNNIVIFYPNPIETIKLWLKRPVTNFQHKKDIDCYWVSAGNSGSYYEPNKIHICPRNATPEFIDDVIQHEITHLIHEHEVQGMTHEEKEKYIKEKEKTT